MDLFLLTRVKGSIPIFSSIFALLVDLMGFIMDVIFKLTSSIGIFNIGLCIILFTLVTRILMLPLSYKQAKSQKLMNIVQPEIMAIQAKYQDKQGDQQAMMQMQAETKAVYEKYGTSMSGSCVQLIIQMPIIFALYKVILNIPAYVSSVKVYFQNIVTAIGGADAISKVNEFAHSTEELSKAVVQARIQGGEIVTENHIIDFLYHINPAQWESFKGLFTKASDVISQNYAKIEEMNNFLGINLASSPQSYGLTNPKAWIIPILAGLTQFAASKITTAGTSTETGNEAADQTAKQMKMMNLMMPLMSVFFCFSFASGIGIYWIASSALMGIQQLIMNKHFAKIDTKKLVEDNIKKANAKRAKKGLPPIDTKKTEFNIEKEQAKKAKQAELDQKKLEESKEKVAKNNEYYHTSSIAERAKMVEQFENKKKK